MHKRMIPDHLKAFFRKFLLHVLFWAIVVSYFAWGFGFNEDYMDSILNAMLYLPGHMFIVYSLLYFLVPHFLIKRKYIEFFVGLLLVVGCCAAYAWFMQLQLSEDDDFKGFNMSTGRSVLPFIHVAGIAISIKLLSYWYQQKQQTLEAQQQRTQAELEMLKSQLHPHFLFNTLNNLYAYTLEQSPKAPEIVLKLSALLRFMIYESNAVLITLKEEINVLKHYTELEKLRYGDRLDISLVISDYIGEYKIAPLLLLPFLENAFKHGTSRQIDQCWISLNLSITDAGILNFKLVNSIDNEQPVVNEPGGIGLMNVSRRLELLYKDRFKLETIMQEEVYIVNLDITLEKLSSDELEENLSLKTHMYEMEMPDR
jgi:hypothetical protein